MDVKAAGSIIVEGRAERGDSSAASLRGLRVLVVDDQQDAADSLAMVFELWGCVVRTEYNALDIVDVVREFSPGFLMLDIEMPGLDGYAACELVRANQKGPVFIAAMTGWSRKEYHLRSDDVGFDIHLVKPISMDVLKDVSLVAAASATTGATD